MLTPLQKLTAIVTLALLAACGGGKNQSSDTVSPKTPVKVGHYKVGEPYQIKGRWYRPKYKASYDQTGIASWYGEPFHGRDTANGETFDRHGISAAHPTLPLPSIVEVTNLENGRSLVVRVNDRGPFHNNRLIDLSEAAAHELGFHGQGLAEVRVRFINLADATGKRPVPEPNTTVASATPASCTAADNMVQVAALSSPARARSVAEEIAWVGPVISEPIARSDQDLVRVRVGPLPTRQQAFTALAHLQQMGYDDAYVADC